MKPRTPIKRTRIKPSKKTAQRRKAIKQLDAECRQQVFERDEHRCVRCRSPRNIQWCHVLSRRHKCLRWEPDNSFAGCAGCHLWWHHEPLLAIDWWKKAYPERYERILAIYNAGAKVNPLELAEQLGSGAERG